MSDPNAGRGTSSPGDRPATPPVPPLKPGAGMPLVPGTPASVGGPISAKGINLVAVLALVVVVVLLILLVVFLLNQFHPFDRSTPVRVVWP